jgi:hypothetical protein
VIDVVAVDHVALPIPKEAVGDDAGERLLGSPQIAAIDGNIGFGRRGGRESPENRGQNGDAEENADGLPSLSLSTAGGPFRL